MEIPHRLRSSIAADDELQAIVFTALSNSKSFFEERPTFFPEYTDHSLRHVEGVLRSADALIPTGSHYDRGPGEGHGPFTPADSATLTLAVLFHDLGMHLTWDGFRNLIASPAVNLPYIDRHSWSQLWEDYVARAYRWDEHKRIAVFGNTEPVRRPPDDGLHATMRDRMFIGEFLRSHHPRLAHEIAVTGFPGITSRLKIVGDSRYAEWIDLTGLLARSHGMPLRRALEIVSDRFHRREFRGIHPAYIMVLLRVADYLQIQAERAPSSRLQIQALKSPVSMREWTTHDVVRNISFDENDPEAVYIDFAARDITTFLRVKDLLAGLQAELDISWAVLGEVFGRDPILRELGLDLRRITSNLDDVDSFARTVDFVPVRCRFEAAPQLLPLLVKPLYGNDVAAGVRELIQNAIDACRERDDILKYSTPEHQIIYREQDADVVVALDGDAQSGWTLTVSDRGVGMTVDVVQKYFLRAGATFRQSPEWQELHATGLDGLSRVARSGRFGIGVLAAYLLGSSVEVETRHLQASSHEPDGLRFSTTMFTDPVALSRCRCPVGTKITIRLDSEIGLQLANAFGLSNDAFGSLPNGLYLLDHPSVHLLRNGKRINHSAGWPSEGEVLPRYWRRMSLRGFAEVQWSYDPKFKGTSRWDLAGYLACNGLAVTRWGGQMPQYKWDVPDVSSLEIGSPAVSVFDHDARLGLTLSRRDLVDRKLGFEQELYEDIISDVIAAILALPSLGNYSDDNRFVPHAGLQERLPILFGRSGYTILTPAFLRLLPPLRIATVALTPRRYWQELPLMLEGENTCLTPDTWSGNRLDDPPKFGNLPIGKSSSAMPSSVVFGYDVDNIRVVAPNELFDKSENRAFEAWPVEWSNSVWSSRGQCSGVREALPASLFTEWITLKQKQQSDLTGWVVEFDRTISPYVRDRPKAFELLVAEFFAHNPWISYDFQERRRNFAQAFRKLEVKIEAHLQEMSDEAGGKAIS
jgi:molecular chaperone HtpG